MSFDDDPDLLAGRKAKALARRKRQVYLKLSAAAIHACRNDSFSFFQSLDGPRQNVTCAQPAWALSSEENRTRPDPDTEMRSGFRPYQRSF